jgi:hypothetical protein
MEVEPGNHVGFAPAQKSRAGELNPRRHSIGIATSVASDGVGTTAKKAAKSGQV